MTYTHGVRTYCGSCGDTGTVLIWHPDAIKAVREGGRLNLTEAAVACKCKAGDKYTTRLRQGNHVPWLDRIGAKWWHVRRTVRERGNLFDVRKDVEMFGTPLCKQYIGGESMATAMKNYEASFDDFNDGNT